MDVKTENNLNKDLILRERLALERTIMTNNTTLLAFIRTSLYFAIAGLTLNNLLSIRYGSVIEATCWSLSVIILSVGIKNYFVQKKKIKDSEKHIGDYKLEWEGGKKK
ncbi:DUF202 domain-containing protein [Flavihumibacter stibioxidans]|uniref:DUF202 domain-containing protein n=1 Tax=Flavihumibacter stibioxidans TaxID=1834163 RepID=A0ABR7M9J7_9BACT|nr:DUF202 domain-containing protein [Flavihumibacter stibioxidans]MBC6491686.1 hypothetical protein [Flavihumibacter stibioxidans]